MSVPPSERRVVVNEHLFSQIQSIQQGENFGDGARGFGRCVNWLLQQHLKDDVQPPLEPQSAADRDIEAVLQHLG